MTESTTPPIRKRWLRFSLRSFLIVVICLSSFIGWYVSRAERQRAANRWVADNQGRVYYDFEIDSAGVPLLNSLSPVPNWLQGILDVNYFANIVQVDLSRTQVKNLTPLSHLTHVETLDLRWTQVSDLKPLVGLRRLEYLLLVGTSVTNLEPLVGHENLDTLILNKTEVRDLTPLSGLKNLKALSLYRCNISAKEISSLRDALPGCNIIVD